MELQLDQEIAQVKDQLLMMAGLVETNLARALKVLTDRDATLLETIEREDDQVDALEMHIDDICIKLMAKRAPVASDLRLITTAMKISTDLERIADQAVGIGRQATKLLDEPPLKPNDTISRMATIVKSMMREALNSFVQKNPDLARPIPARDKEVDELNRKVYRELTEQMVQDPNIITRALRLLFIARFLERIGDHAANIAEDVVFVCEAIDIRHAGQAKT